jgi:hypothetical protein
VPIYVFWPQVKINGTWSAQATNLVGLIDLINIPKPLAILFNKIGLQILNKLKDITKIFVIPPDNDDSSVNLALLGLLK